MAENAPEILNGHRELGRKLRLAHELGMTVGDVVVPAYPIDLMILPDQAGNLPPDANSDCQMPFLLADPDVPDELLRTGIALNRTLRNAISVEFGAGWRDTEAAWQDPEKGPVLSPIGPPAASFVGSFQRALQGHSLCDSQPHYTDLLTAIKTSVVISPTAHPNAAGYGVLAAALEHHLKTVGAYDRAGLRGRPRSFVDGLQKVSEAELTVIFAENS